MNAEEKKIHKEIVKELKNKGWTNPAINESFARELILDVYKIVSNQPEPAMPKIADGNHTLVKLILEALQTDGAHHKQYFLEKIFRFICEDSYVEEAKKELQWEDGIPN